MVFSAFYFQRMNMNSSILYSMRAIQMGYITYFPCNTLYITLYLKKERFFTIYLNTYILCFK